MPREVRDSDAGGEDPADGVIDLTRPGEYNLLNESQDERRDLSGVRLVVTMSFRGRGR